MTPPATFVALDSLTPLLAAMFGAAFGSFFNVVIYRWPRGKSLVWPASNCPHCARPIRLRHNIPVLGWLLLRGRCFDCDAPIAVRYPLVEAVTALTFGLLTWLEPVSLGSQLPAAPSGVAGLVSTVDDLWWSLGLHALLLSGLLILACIDFDGYRVPRGLAIGLVVVAVATIVARPAVLPVPAFAALVEQWSALPWCLSGFSAVYGAIVGLVFGAVIAPATSIGRSGAVGRINGLAGLSWIGAVLGAQAVATIAAAAMLVYQFAIMYRFGFQRLQRVTFPFLIWAGSYGWILFWKPLAQNSVVPLDMHADWRVFVAQALIVLAATAIAYGFRGPQQLAESVTPSES